MSLHLKGNQYWRLRDPNHPNLRRTQFKEVHQIDRDRLWDLYAKQGLTTIEIAKMMGCSHQTVIRRIKKYGIPLNGLSKKRLEALQSRPDLRPSPNLAYMVGALLGDGTLSYNEEKYHYHVALYTKDKEFMDEFCSKAKSIGLPVRVYRDGHGMYLPTIHQKAFCSWFRNISLDELLVDKPCIAGFLRGFYDAEGSFVVKLKRGKVREHKYAFIQMSNTNKQLLQKVSQCLKILKIHSVIKLGTHKGERREIGGKKVVAGKNCYHLEIYRQRDIMRFLSEVGSSIPRKRGEGVEWDKTEGGNPWWSREETETVKRLYPQLGSVRLSKMLNRTPVAIRTKAWRIGVVRRG